ncbi:LOW QUALITY PROTEIN: double-stranded RNA-binding protein Staufen homolog 1 [Sinocyclocheilus grahami]|uniref:LOW QUALITY PROTEIN: double-stranded RNA-binding protein Staufen homolog 1 n=1 Tax=Sinocyclocheilus grahami TaxID=75366 RepID=UPI003A9A5E0D
MSQLQFQAPGNPAPSAAPLQLAPPQPGFSIPCAAAPLPSESASHPLRNSALPSASATPFCNPTVSNMANPKEKTPMCLVNELARYNKIQPEYKLLSEQGPAHSKIFSVRLTLGDQHWDAEGTSIKKAQHSAATCALAQTTLPKPSHRSPRHPGGIYKGSEYNVTHTVELNALCMKLGKKPIYKPIDAYQGMRPAFNYNIRAPGPYARSMQHYYYPFPPVGPVLYHMELSIGGQQKEKEPEYTLVTERGLPRRREFVMQVSVGGQNAEGMGPSKKVAKRNAAEKMLELLGFKVPQPQPPKPALKTDEKGCQNCVCMYQRRVSCLLQCIFVSKKAALNILKLLSELDQQSNERTANGPMTGCNKQDLKGDALLKPANSSTIGKTLDGTV